MTQNFEIFDDAADHIENVGWIKGGFQEGVNGPTCLVGGINQARRNHYEVPPLLSSTSRYVQYLNGPHATATLPKAMLKELDKTLSSKRGYRVALKSAREVYSGDIAIQHAIQTWNDMPWRRKKTVVKVLRDTAERTRSDWMPERIAELEAQVEYLTAKLAAEKAESSRLRKLLGKALIPEVKELQSELDAATEELEILKAV